MRLTLIKLLQFLILVLLKLILVKKVLEEEENGFSWEVHHGDESSDNANHTDSILQVEAY